jgi:hypothetical protein
MCNNVSFCLVLLLLLVLKVLEHGLYDAVVQTASLILVFFSPFFSLGFVLFFFILANCLLFQLSDLELLFVTLLLGHFSIFLVWLRILCVMETFSLLKIVFLVWPSFFCPCFFIWRPVYIPTILSVRGPHLGVSFRGFWGHFWLLNSPAVWSVCDAPTSQLFCCSLSVVLHGRQ